MTKQILWASALAIIACPPLNAQDATLRIRHDAVASELVFTIGPLDLPAGEHHAHAAQPRTQSVVIPVDAFVHGFTTEMIDAEGRTLPGVLLHHVNIIAPQRRELFSGIMQRVGAAGAETGPIQLPRVLGYRIERGDSLTFTAMFHNPTGVEYSGAALRVRMRYSAPNSILPTLAIQPFYVDVMPPAGFHVFVLPPGKSSRSWEGRPAIAGRILGLGGHMHKYGTSLRFEDVTTGRVVWEAKPEVDESGNVQGVPRKLFLWRLGVKMDPSHTYRLTVDYDNPTAESIENGAMGTLGGIFVPDDGEAWPEIDREHPEYVADLKVMYPDRTGGSGAHQH